MVVRAKYIMERHYAGDAGEMPKAHLQALLGNITDTEELQSCPGLVKNPVFLTAAIFTLVAVGQQRQPLVPLSFIQRI